MFFIDTCIMAFRKGVGKDLDCFYSSHYKGRGAPDYYRFLWGFCKIIEAKTVIEIGTFHGGSCYAMGDIPGINIYTVDIEDQITNQRRDNIKYIIGDSRDSTIVENLRKEITQKRIDLLYVDSVHSYESTFENMKLYGSKFHPKYVILDDIRLNAEMKQLWRDLKKYEKMDVGCLLNRHCGFGVIKCR